MPFEALRVVFEVCAKIWMKGSRGRMSYEKSIVVAVSKLGMLKYGGYCSKLTKMQDVPTERIGYGVRISKSE